MAVVAVAYVGFRWWVLGGIGGYGAGQSIAFAVYFDQLQQALFGSKYPYWLSAGFGLAWLGVMVRGGWRYGSVLGVILGVLLLPMLAVAGLGFDGVSIRFAFAFAWVVAVGWVLAGYLLSKRNSWLLMFLGMALFAVLCLSQKMVVVRRVASGQANQWVVTHVYDPKEVLFVEGKEYSSAEIARARALLGESAPTVITTREGVAQLSDDFVVFTHQVACQCVRQIAGGRAALLTSWQQAAEDGKGKPLQIYLKINTLNPRGTAGVRVGSAEWSFGPYKQGTYWVDTTDFGMGLPSQGSHRFYSAVPKWRIRIRYTAPQGWTVETPELTLPLAQGAEVRWEKPPQP